MSGFDVLVGLKTYAKSSMDLRMGGDEWYGGIRIFREQNEETKFGVKKWKWWVFFPNFLRHL